MKAQANEILEGVLDLEINLSDVEQGKFNPQNINLSPPRFLDVVFVFGELEHWTMTSRDVHQCSTVVVGGWPLDRKQYGRHGL